MRSVRTAAGALSPAAHRKGLDLVSETTTAAAQTRTVTAAVTGLSGWGGHLLTAPEVRRLTGTGPQDWARFARHWDDLTLDTFMKDGGTYRYRRYGHFRLDARTGELTAQPHAPYFQDSALNPLNGGVRRTFDPLTEAFLADPLTEAVVRLLGDVFSRAEGARHWDVKLHPFRIVTSPDQTGRPAPRAATATAGPTSPRSWSTAPTSPAARAPSMTTTATSCSRSPSANPATSSWSTTASCCTT